MPDEIDILHDLAPGLLRWLVFELADTSTAAELMHGFGTRLNDAGLELLRMNLQLRPLSPQVSVMMFVWRPIEREMEFGNPERVVGRERHVFDGGIVQTTALAHGGGLRAPEFIRSPWYRLMVEGEPVLRRPIAPDQTDFDFPILVDAKAQGATEYLAIRALFYGSDVSGFSFLTRRPGGFTDEQVAGLRVAIAALSKAIAPRAWEYATRTLLGAYLGKGTSERVLAGKVERGDVEEIDAAIWFSDLRGFTPMSAGTPSRELIGWLNEYFSAVAGPISKHGGEILKFIGDAILAVWPVTPERSRESACTAALSAAHGANLALDALNEARKGRGLPPMHHGIGLHVGSAQYGNIGAEGRLDFTVIGPAVNTASRLEGVTAKLGLRVVASADFAHSVGDAVECIGEVELKGIEGPQRIFALRA